MEQRTYLLDFSLGDILCRLSTVAPDYQERPKAAYYQHSHTYFELHYVTQGKCVCKVDDQRVEINADQMLLVEPGAYHSIKNTTPMVSKICVGFEIYRPEREVVSREIRSFLDTFFQTKSVVLDLTQDPTGTQIGQVLSRIGQISARQSMGMIEAEELKCLCGLLLLKLYRELSRNQPGIAPSSNSKKEQRDYRIDEFFNKNFQRNDGNELLAKHLCVSTRQLDRILQRTYGMGYQKKLIEIRLEIAVDLLRTTDKSVSEISELLGYSSPSSFSAFIKRETNQSPSQIRKGQ